MPVRHRNCGTSASKMSRYLRVVSTLGRGPVILQRASNWSVPTFRLSQTTASSETVPLHPSAGKSRIARLRSMEPYGLTATHDFQRKLQLQRNSRGRVRVGCVPRSSLRRDRSGKLGRPGLIGDSSVSLQPGIVGKPFQFGEGDRANRVVTKPAVLGREIAGGRSSIRCIMHHSADAIWRSALYLTMGFVSAKAGQFSLSLSDSCVCTVAGLVRRARFSAFFSAISFALSSIEITRSGAALPKRLR